MTTSMSEVEMTQRREELLALVESVGVSRAVAVPLVERAPLVWWEATPHEQASDILLVAPGLRPREVRLKIATPDGDDPWQVSIVAPDRVGLLARTATVCSRNGLSIGEARITSWPGLALQRLAITQAQPKRSMPNVEPDWISIGQQLRAALADEEGDLDVAESVWACDFSIDSIEPQQDGSTLLRVSGSDGIGVLAGITRSLSLAGADIRSASLGASNGRIHDAFVVVSSDPLLRGLVSSLQGHSSEPL